MSSYIISNREPIQFDKGRTRFALRLTPKGRRDAIEGWLRGSDGASYLKARVAAAPESGKANAALIALLAGKLGIAKSRVAIVGGETARMKIVEIAGDGDALATALKALGDKA
ncbi:MAG: DUF167 family protein [Rhizomicrobium sp.]|jgi:uncharacterized protein YggU (UPF0235/DUF167 family)